MRAGPAKTTLTPAYLSFQAAFTNNQWGQGAAIAFLLFFIIVAMTWLQRVILRDKYDARVARQERRNRRTQARAAKQARKAGKNVAVDAGTGASASAETKGC